MDLSKWFQAMNLYDYDSSWPIKNACNFVLFVMTMTMWHSVVIIASVVV